MAKKVHVIAHTHWDFEWYFTVNESSIQFVYHMDEVLKALEEGILDYYLLDGQMSIIDDYLRYSPENKIRLKNLVQAKKLFIGPWYTQTDELIISGESIIRNLQIGMKKADELGGVMRIGYLPDSFGQSKDMPKIYYGMGISEAVFWRGVPNEKVATRDFIWQSEDGSEVIAANIKNGYFVGVGLIEQPLNQNLISTIAEGASTNHLLLPVGGDQRFVDFNLKERLNTANETWVDVDLLESNYPAYFNEIRDVKLPKVQGEFISSSVSKIHRSIYSSRYDQKYMNDKIERRLIYQLEPLMIMAETLGIPYKSTLLEEIWQLALRNHAHDSAGGCNSDATNRIINERLKEVDELSYSTVDYLTRKIAESCSYITKNDVVFFNTLPYQVKKVIRFTISVTSENIHLFQADREIDCQILRTNRHYRGTIKRDESQYDPTKYYYEHTVSAEIELPGLSFAIYHVEEDVAQVKIEQPTAKTNQIENQHYLLTIENGNCSLYDKETDKFYPNFLWLEDGGDEGDTYDYSPAYENAIYALDFSDAKQTVTKGKMEEILTLTGEFCVAKDLAGRKEQQRDAILPYQFEFRLAKGADTLECNLKIHNTARDHRMRLIIKTDVEAQNSYADTPFGTVSRPVIDPHLNDWKTLNWREEPTSIFPMLHYVNLHQDHSSWTIFTKGMKEYQIIGTKFDQIAVTLFRSVGYLGRPDLLRRPGDASGNQFRYVETPDSQLETQLHFKFAIQLSESYDPAKLMYAYQNYAISKPYYQIQSLNAFTTALKYFVSNRLPKEITAPLKWQIKPQQVVFSACQRSEQGGMMLRFYNPHYNEKTSEEEITLPQEMAYTFTDLNGKVLSEQKKGQKISLGIFNPGEIKTIIVYPN